MFEVLLSYFEKKPTRLEEAAASKIEAEIEAMKAEGKIEIESMTVKFYAEKAKSEAEKAKSEAEKAKINADEEWEKKYGFVKYIPAAAAGVIGLVLVTQYIFRDSKTFIKWRMKYHIRRGDTVPEILVTSSTPSYFFSRNVTQQMPALSQVPIFLIGPTGCGKSTALHEYAVSLIESHTPTVLINLRKNQRNNDNNASGLTGSGVVQLEKLAESVCERTFYPYHRSFLHNLLSNVKFAKHGATVDGKDLFPSQYFLVDRAFETLFECLREISKETSKENIMRLRRGDPVRTAPVLLIDEVHDLIKDSRLAKVGGNELFERIGTLLTGDCVDAKRFHAILASSSNQMVNQFANRKMLVNPKSEIFEMDDFDHSVVSARLREIGYSESDVNEILNVAGTRLRRLWKPLNSDTLIDVQKWKNDQLSAASFSFKQAFALVGKSNWPYLVALLEDIRLHKFVAYHGDTAKFIDKFDLSFILYLSKEEVRFQSRTHELYWSENFEKMKKIYLRNVKHKKSILK